MKNVLSLALLLALTTTLRAQEQELLEYEKKIELAVVNADISFLQKAYADDFRFKHGTGLVDSKTSWLKTVAKNKGQYLSRDVDSVEVEIHDRIGITNGKITVTRKTDGVIKEYMLRYVRVYVRKEHWELIMHRTVFEIDY